MNIEKFEQAVEKYLEAANEHQRALELQDQFCNIPKPEYKSGYFHPLLFNYDDTIIDAWNKLKGQVNLAVTTSLSRKSRAEDDLFDTMPQRTWIKYRYIGVISWQHYGKRIAVRPWTDQMPSLEQIRLEQDQ